MDKDYPWKPQALVFHEQWFDLIWTCFIMQYIHLHKRIRQYAMNAYVSLLHKQWWFHNIFICFQNLYVSLSFNFMQKYTVARYLNVFFSLKNINANCEINTNGSEFPRHLIFILVYSTISTHSCLTLLNIDLFSKCCS